MSWTGYPTDIVVAVVALTKFGHFRIEELHTVVIHEDGCCAALEFVSGDGDFEGLNCWIDDTGQRFFIDGTLDRDVGEFSGDTSFRGFSGKEDRIPESLT
jgi:hypothetical protein